MGGGGQSLGGGGVLGGGGFPGGATNWITGGTPLKQDGPFAGRDQFGRTGPFQGRDAGGIYNPNTLYGKGAGLGSAGWANTHPDYKGPASGVGSTDWMKTHPNYGGGQVSQPAQWQGGGYPAQLGGGEPPGSYFAQGGGQGWDISQAFQHLFGGNQNFGPYTNWM